MSDRKPEHPQPTSAVELEASLPLQKEIQQVFSKPVNRYYRSNPISRLQEEQKIYGVVVGEIFKVADEAGIFVNYPNNPYTTPLLAMSTLKLNAADAGRQVVLAFDQGDPLRPIVTGLLQYAQSSAQELAIEVTDESQGKPLQAKLDGDHVTLSAEKEIVLQCGKSSITLTKAGKIIIRGEYLLSRSTGVNKIKGGSVQIN